MSEINASIPPGNHQNENQDENADENENEKALLGQLLFNITGKTPDEMKVEQPQSRGWQRVITVLMALLTSYSIATLGYLSGSLGIDQSAIIKALHRHLPDPMLAFTKKYAPLLAELSVLLIATLMILYLFSGLQKLRSGQISRLPRLESSTGRSASDSYLHQITHAFAHSGHNVVIVENMLSRCQLDTLHRVNGYLNGSGLIQQPIYFVYVLADEILTARERTRFFDLIIPITPALNCENAGYRLYKQLKTIKSSGRNVADQMDKALIYNVAHAIDDMELMANIVNEFHIYLDQFSPGHKALNKNKLFSMVVIKNLYPKEHAELTHDMGIFWKVFNENELPDKTVAEMLHQGVRANSVSRELTVEHFRPVLYLIINGYFAEDYRDYLFYCSPDTPDENQVTSWQPVTIPPQHLKYQVSTVSQKNSNFDGNHDNVSKAIISSIAAITDIRPIVRLVDSHPEIWAWLKKHQVKFDRLSLRHCTQRMAFRIIEDEMYTLNSHMVGLLLAFTTEQQPTALAPISYSALCSCGHHRLIGQIHENLHEFVTNVLLVQPDLKEDQRYLVELLNAPVLKTDDKMQLLKQSRHKLPSIRETLNYSLSLSAQLLEENLVTASWADVLHIFQLNQKNSLNPLLIKFISIPENTETLALHALPNNPDTANLLMVLIHTKEIRDATLNQLLSAFPAFYLEDLNLKDISPSRIEIISQHPKCQFSFVSLEWLAKNENHGKPDTAFDYLLRFWNEYKASAVNTTQLTVNTIVRLLSSDKIKVNDQLWLCNLLNDENEIDGRILAAMLSPITSQPAEHFAMKIGFIRLETLMAMATSPEKIRLLSQQVKHLSWHEVLTLLSRLDIEGTGQLMKENNQFSLSGTWENIELIKALKQAYHIESVVVKEDQRIRACIKQSSPQSIR
ncbi:hypothetical protein MJO57_30505 [Endozoicomonas sp. SCSIO W0465]|nr:hypothetical protein [Endozoicomonas sp. SCSIO W0465]USE36309.1 hypothetical protein MJO57_30505 [Endozoicomonas sp. SCSIO W0465]